MFMWTMHGVALIVCIDISNHTQHAAGGRLLPAN